MNVLCEPSPYEANSLTGWRFYYAPERTFGMELTDEEKARIAKREYMREYQRKRKEQRKAEALRYWVRRYNKTHGEAGEHDDR